MPKFDINKALNKINEYTNSKNDNDNNNSEDQQWKDEVLNRLARIEEKLDKK
ncbi:hypothetical protein KFZ58_17270 [Virgibacillus sp. NKC19-16]|uniref:hypothetical protein n=1 Tax=Virgibacillus salidurans TaxID=2831673 RepID=UPI001F2CAB68|nr:hypothetical protein [Virgibacillus sp. NKC19-16]UJL46090.1 hypothetical protein KFZ58_17270 [Virgibacillus sp. NKC19-16]